MFALFMRHAQTNYNVLKLCNDDPQQDVHLSELGIQQATAAAVRLKDMAIDRIIVSQLPRTRQTADIINQHHHVDIEINPVLNDIRSGFEGRPVAEYFAAVAADPFNISINGGESLKQHQQRVLPYLNWLRQQTCSLPLTIAHEETLRVFYAYHHQIPDKHLRTINIRNCQLLQITL